MRKYRIYTIYTDNKTKNYYGVNSENGDIMSFESENDIIEQVRKMRMNTGLPYMWEVVHEIHILKDDGTVEIVEDMIGNFEDKRKKRKFYNKISDVINRIWNKTTDMYWNCIYGFERMFKGYDRRASWNIDIALLNFIKKNVSILMKNTHTCPSSYVVKAIKILNPNISEDEAKKSNGTEEEISVAMALWKTDLGKLVENCKLATFYENYGIQDPEDEDWVDPLVHKIPYKEFSKEIDYTELDRLSERNYDKIFRFLREHFKEMWD